VDEPVTRLVHTSIGLGELFAGRATAAKMHVEMVYVEELGEKLTGFLRARSIARIGMCDSALLEKIGVPGILTAGGFDLRRWGDLSLDAAYDLDCGLTDVAYAIAETGSLVIRPAPGHGRALSLTPPIHVAIVEPKNLLPDLVDLFEALHEAPGSVTLITGPSKTSDIEGVLVEGVHGPGFVQVFVLQ
jgi:L-lactate dehydrogenase complex protein LldG